MDNNDSVFPLVLKPHPGKNEQHILSVKDGRICIRRFSLQHVIYCCRGRQVLMHHRRRRFPDWSHFQTHFFLYTDVCMLTRNATHAKHVLMNSFIQYTYAHTCMHMYIYSQMYGIHIFIHT